MQPLHVDQSLPVCCTLAAIGGILEVGATAVTAVPAVREKEGLHMKWWVQGLAIAGNVALQAIGSLISHLIATWFGPVSLVVPFFYSATLLSNMLIFGLLGEKFTKNMKVGTYVIVVAVILLPAVGPNVQEDQDISILMRHSYSIVWFSILLMSCGITGILLVMGIARFPMNMRVMILLIARAAAISVNLTVSRSFILGPTKPVLIAFIVIKILSGAIYTYAIVVQSYAVEQARFVPLNATLIIIVNALTGVIIWEDWKVVESWHGYVCVFVLLGLGCDLLLSVPLLNAENPEFGAKKRANFILHPGESIRRLRVESTAHPDVEHVDSGEQSQASRLSRKNAWKDLVSPVQASRATASGADNGFRNGHSVDDSDEDYFTKTQMTFADDDVWVKGTPPPTKKRPSHDFDAATETTGLLLDGRTSETGQYAYETPQIDRRNREYQSTTTTTAVQEDEGAVRLRRIDAWKETISPLKPKKIRSTLAPDAQQAQQLQSQQQQQQQPPQEDTEVP